MCGGNYQKAAGRVQGCEELNDKVRGGGEGKRVPANDEGGMKRDKQRSNSESRERQSRRQTCTSANSQGEG